MPLVDVKTIGSQFESLSDPRHVRNRKHPLVDVIVISVCGVICGSNGPTAIHRWAVSNADWLPTLLQMPNGIPSRDCIRRVLMMLNPEAFQRCFQEWIAGCLESRGGPGLTLVAVDGKTHRRSHDAANGLGALHVVSAWCSEHGIALGQVACDEKSNEITAIPELLDQIALPDTLITIDAMGCQKAIAEKIVTGGGNFVLAVKDNQPKLLAAIREFFDEQINKAFEDLQYRFHETMEEGHGRIDERAYYLARIPKDFPLKADWPWVKAIGYTVRLTRHPDGRETHDVRFYILSRYLSGRRFAEAVRGHWGIEAMHWVLDVTFREDDSRTRERTLGNNLSWLRRFAISLLKRHPLDDSIRGKMQRAGWNKDFLTEVLAG
jgi:predicted transposase YbfD/YdcC